MPENITARVQQQQDLGQDYFLLRIAGARIAAAAKAGQFVMLGLGDPGEMLIRRPFSVARLADTAEPPAFDIVYKVVGRCTLAFSRLGEGAELNVLGPLGRGFWRPGADAPCRPVMVAGGIGIAPFPLLVQQLGEAAGRAELIYGGRSAGDLPLAEWFEPRCRKVTLATEDGSVGLRGRVTTPLESALEGVVEQDGTCVFACGPHPMLKAVAEICLARKIPCQLALEETMACGFGVCLGCVVPRRHPADAFDSFVRVCTEGPVFDAREILL
ncbi:MAG: dihydroorotate dehydrogenase electron transfer subunit [Acidobacteriota bacterium]|nr:dihydroorotate dehydrogenase electron transfer subunit [Acidobacteriota bacterium]MDQ7086645.1 dihydroorotate dehydrogenase electron transfer subunit [Acidobacteriota bacterium]